MMRDVTGRVDYYLSSLRGLIDSRLSAQPAMHDIGYNKLAASSRRHCCAHSFRLLMSEV
jgi:hypothetical protein